MPQIFPVQNPQDVRIALYHNIRDRDLQRQETFIAEGKVVLANLVGNARFSLRSCLVLRSRLDGLSDILANASPDLPVYVVDQPVMDAIAGFHLHRGVLALVERPEPIAAAELLASLPGDARVVAMVGIANHDNVGAIFRNAAAFEADAVLLDDTCCDPLYRKAIRVSVGAALRVPFARAGSGADLAVWLAQADFETIALSPSGRESIAEVQPDGRLALLLGTEGEGLPIDLMKSLRTVRIPMSQGFDSLNVAAASAIALHRLGRFVL